MKRQLLIIVLLLGAVSLFTNQSINGITLSAQTVVAPSSILWTLIDSKDNVKVYRAYTTCDNSIKVLIKLENTNSYKVRVSWGSIFNLSGNILPINKPFSFVINANETLGGSCNQSELVLDPYKYVTDIKKGVSDYQIKDLKIEKI